MGDILPTLLVIAAIALILSISVGRGHGLLRLFIAHGLLLLVCIWVAILFDLMPGKD
jgi:hypothetical protein